MAAFRRNHWPLWVGIRTRPRSAEFGAKESRPQAQEMCGKPETTAGDSPSRFLNYRCVALQAISKGAVHSTFAHQPKGLGLMLGLSLASSSRKIRLYRAASRNSRILIDGILDNWASCSHLSRNSRLTCGVCIKSRSMTAPQANKNPGAKPGVRFGW